MDATRRKIVLGLGATSVAAGLGIGAVTNFSDDKSAGGEHLAVKGQSQNRTTTKPSEQVLGDRPNIIVFISDDQAYDTVGGRTNFYASPNTDELAGHGYLLERSYVTTSICPVSRANILTGQFAERHQQLGWLRPIADDSFSTIYPFEMRQAGYQVGFVGKWGIANPLPSDQFDYLDGFEDQGRYFEDSGDRTHLTGELTDSACAAIDQFTKSPKPYLLIVCYKAPHGQLDLPLHEAIDTTINYPAFDMSAVSEYPASVRGFDELPDFLEQSVLRSGFESFIDPLERYQQYRKAYAELLFGVDVSIGAITDHATNATDLDELEILSLSDNGMMLGEHGIFGKWLMYEQSVAIPFVWKPSIYSSHSPAINKSFCLTIDVAPTVLRAGRVEIPSTYQGTPLQDLSVEARPEYYYSYYATMGEQLPVCHGLQDERYKYIEFDHHDYQQLFDTVTDPSEVNNLISDPALNSRIRDMKASLAIHRENAGPYFEKA